MAAVPGTAGAETGESVVLSEDSLASMAADLDGDGDREVIVVRRHPDDAVRTVVEAWGVTDGAWVSLGSTPLETWDAEAGAPRPAEFAREGFGLLSLRDGPRTRAIVATATAAESITGVCCLSLSSVGIGPAGISLDLVEREFGSAESLQVADLDGDGIDEILTAYASSPDDGSTVVREHTLLRQVGDGFEPEPVVLDMGETLYLSLVAETDGAPGDDLLFMEENSGRVVRVVDDDGLLRAEPAASDAFGSRGFQGWPAGANGGLIVWAQERGLSTVRWPRGQEPVVVAQLRTPGFPNLVPLGGGRNARWVDFGGGGPGSETLTTRIYDAELQLERVVDVPALTRRLWDATSRGPLSAAVPERNLWEQAGPIPGGLGPDRPAVLGHGSLLELEPDGSVRVEAAAHLVGVGVMGSVGPASGWLAVAGEWWWGSGATAYLGNVGYEPQFSMVGVIPLTELLGTRAVSTPAVEMSGATLVGSGADERLFTSGDEFQLTVSGGPGDLVVAYDERRSAAEEVTGDAVTLTIDPPGRDDRNREFQLSVFVIGPTGVTVGTSWQAEALRVAPEVTAAAELETFAMQATIAGQVTSNVTLTVDGATVVPSPSGAFRVQVDAPIWPRDVLVVARDPLGNESVQRLEVIGFVDYRGLPWIPIVGTLTVGAGLLLFVRTPRLRPEARLRPDGDGRLEEIDGDLI
jgi:hypothetical protein